MRKIFLIGLILNLGACASDGVNWNGMIQGFAELDRYERAHPQYEPAPILVRPPASQCVPQYDFQGNMLGCF